MEFISNIVELISAFRAETRQDAITPDSLDSLLLRMINALRYAWSSSTHPFYHIQCDTKDGRLIVKHPTDLTGKGFSLVFSRKCNAHFQKLSYLCIRFGGIMAWQRAKNQR